MCYISDYGYFPLIVHAQSAASFPQMTPLPLPIHHLLSESPHMKKRNMAVTALISIAVVGVIGFLLISPAPLKRDAPRDLPWELPDDRRAHTQWEVGDDGRIYAEVEHFFLAGISPARVAWFY